MIDENKLAVDESNRVNQYEAVKGRVQQEVNAEIANHADHLDENEQAQAAAVGGQLKRKALNEVTSTEAELERSKLIARVSQVIGYLFYLIYGLISLQIILDLLGARRGNGFRNFIDTLCAPLLAPFNSLMPSVGSGSFQLRLSYVFALVVYLLLHMAINGLLRLLAHRKTAI
ncbi:MAG: YggT family protein [Blastocatellia bacterium]